MTFPPRYFIFSSYKYRLLLTFSSLSLCICPRIKRNSLRLEVFLVDSEYFGQALVSEVYVSWMHLVKDTIIAVVVFKFKLGLNLIEVERHILRFLLLLLLKLQLICTSFLCIVNATLARLWFRGSQSMRGTISSLTNQRSVRALTLIPS